MVGKCLKMPLSEVEHFLSKTAPEVEPTLPTSDSGKDIQGRQQVIWDEAYHFLVRHPSAATCGVKISYTSSDCSGGLFTSSKESKLSAHLRMEDVLKGKKTG